MKITSQAIVACLFISVWLAGCSTTLNKYYDYKPASISYEEFDVYVMLIGTFKSIKQETIKGSPYSLLISFQSNSKDPQFVSLESIKLFDIKTKELVFERNQIQKIPFKRDSDGTFVARLISKAIDLEYGQYNLVVRFKLERKDSIIENEIDLRFKKDYKENRSNKFWDKLMSV